MAQNMQRDIFKEVALLAGDIVFRYDILTNKFMQYTDKEEVTKYGSWIFDFVKSFEISKLVYEGDIEVYREVMSSISKGDKCYIEGEFRARFNNNTEYKWFKLIAKTVYEDGVPVEVIGRMNDIDEYKKMQKADETGKSYKGTTMKSRESFLDSIVAYGNRTDMHTDLACILVSVPKYNSIIRSGKIKDEKEFQINISEHLKRSFSYGASVGKLGVNIFGIFIGGTNLFTDILVSLQQIKDNIQSLGTMYGIDMDIYMGITIEKNSDDVVTKLFDHAYMALKRAENGAGDNIVFFKEDMESNMYMAQQAATVEPEAAKIPQDKVYNKSLIAYAYRIFKENGSILNSVNFLLEKTGKKYNIDRISIALLDNGEYKEYASWSSWNISDLLNGNLLHINAKQSVVEERLTLEKTYILDNTGDYPDDSVYGRMISSTLLKSVAQYLFEGVAGVRGVISFESYHAPHWWTKEELITLEASGDIAEFYSQYK